ncbi:amino acid/amide ABC transporter substrate-binding protein (HAAT family) [Hydrogenoanaerobacterium saccharovorans]|uniref:Amino acid/amide ABC transporter substrate-binding protein, HAAT family n=1 Tax=Hydrogenoanaerobacterium saccharovorans TaxID=474960 RepID=A0A1H8CP36_9FIRM|nr:ABC transporter substrate-binding protein [Hydrogenoanaerobacterium saccharovorans]RPF43211.1 amino acid/amide ABC transporter substrate-binding protein (HAAT family) [Hydrogenoanaerobacterium saccharovorans]SEM96224.1 amino acid/amide ABC transporter substrate-binding protein, HAAT family [Hydrogenoanaerobacterium saccharovorans]
MKRALSIILAIAMMVSMLAGCGAANNSSKAESGSEADGGSAPATSGVVKIAVAGPMTGDNAEYGKGFLNAAEMKAEEWNKEGGVLGKKVEIVAFDDKNSGEEAASIAQKIVSDKEIVGVIGHFASGVCMVAAPTYEENKVIEISPSASHPDYSGIGDYIYRNNTVISVEAAAGLDIAVNDLGKKNIGIISIKTDWGTSTSAVVKGLIEEKAADGVKLVAHEEVMEGSDDYSPAITKLKAAGADVVICVGMYSLVAPVAKQYKQVDPAIEIVGFSNSYSQQLLELGGEAVEGVRFPVIFFSGSSDPKIKTYVDTFTEKYGTAPSALTSQAYDSVGMLLEAIKTAGTTETDKVREALQNIDYPGVTGQTKFDEIGDVQKAFVKVTVKDGQFVQL